MFAWPQNNRRISFGMSIRRGRCESVLCRGILPVPIIGTTRLHQPIGNFEFHIHRADNNNNDSVCVCVCSTRVRWMRWM